MAIATITNVVVALAYEYVTDPINPRVQATFNWTDPAGAVGNTGNVFLGSGGNFDPAATVGGAGTPDSDTFSAVVQGLTPGVAYSYYVETDETDQFGRGFPIAQSMPADLSNLKPPTAPTNLVEPSAEPHVVQAPVTSSLSVSLKNAGQPVAGSVQFKITSSDDHKLFLNGSSDRTLSAQTDINGEARLTFVPGVSTGVATIELSCAASGTKPKINLNVKK